MYAAVVMTRAFICCHVCVSKKLFPPPPLHSLSRLLHPLPWLGTPPDGTLVCSLAFTEEKQRRLHTLTNELLDLNLLNATHRETASSLHKKSQALVSFRLATLRCDGM